MSSTQETHLLPPPPPKPKLSPLELRNTDLVSRLLAATPPYLYNMSLLPNTYFFSEMLRSLVQAKNEQRGNVANGFGAGGGNMFYGHPMRRSRKRAWNHANRENSFTQSSANVEEKAERPSVDNNEPWMIKSMRRSEESALELTTNTTPKVEDQHQKTPKLEEPPLAFPQQSPEGTSNLVLPPPPPMWYPPIYPTPPYGIDPLHFFIDLRVSGHIYDRQNGKEAASSNATSRDTVTGSNTEEKNDIKLEESAGGIFGQKRHCSAFSVPKNRPQTKFDVKSMGFDKGSNRTNTNYVMNNISDIYKKIHHSLVTQGIEEQVDVDTDHQPVQETDEVKQKKVKDLRALIGLELVVDYMSHKKGVVRGEESSVESEEEEMSTDVETCGSPQLEVVAIQDEA